MSTKGFIILAQNSEGIDYVRQAYALALSIKITQPEYNSVSLVTDAVVPTEYLKAFDHVIDIPYSDSAKLSAWKVENRWKFIHASPYDETIVLDSDMLFFKDITNLWTHLAHHDVYFANKILDHRNNIVTDLVNRKTFAENNLPNVYFAFHYFKKTARAFEFYKTLEFVVKNWIDIYSTLTPNSQQKWLSMDVSAAIATKILDMEAEVTNNHLPTAFVHMKPNLQGWSPVPAEWINSADYYFDNTGALYINQFKQNENFHYTEDKFLTDAVIKMLEAQYD
jgi:hypothetical protein